METGAGTYSKAIGVVMVATYLGMILTDSIPLLIVVTLVSGVAQGLLANPQLDTVPTCPA